MSKKSKISKNAPNRLKTRFRGDFGLKMRFKRSKIPQDASFGSKIGDRVSAAFAGTSPQNGSVLLCYSSCVGHSYGRDWPGGRQLTTAWNFSPLLRLSPSRQSSSLLDY